MFDILGFLVERLAGRRVFIDVFVYCFLVEVEVVYVFVFVGNVRLLGSVVLISGRYRFVCLFLYRFVLVESEDGGGKNLRVWFLCICKLWVDK